MEQNIKHLTDALIEAVDNNVGPEVEKTAGESEQKSNKKVQMSDDLRKVASHMKSNLTDLAKLSYEDLHSYIERCK